MIEYVREQRFGVVSTLGPDGEPQSAFLSITATDLGEFVFDAKPDSRKVANIRRDPRIAVVVGGSDGTTLQAEGRADLPDDPDLARCAAEYVQAFPEFADSVHDRTAVVIRVRLDRAKYSDFRGPSPVTAEVAV